MEPIAARRGQAAGGRADRPDAVRRRGHAHQLRRFGPGRAEFHRRPPAVASRRWRPSSPRRGPRRCLEALKLAAGLANPGRSAEDISDVRVAEAMPATLYIFSDGRFGPVAGFALGNLDAEVRARSARPTPGTWPLRPSASAATRRSPTGSRRSPGWRISAKEPAKVSLELFLDDRHDRRRRGRSVARAKSRGVQFRPGGGRARAC